MKHTEIHVLDEHEQEYIHLLQSLGMNAAMAKILVCIALNGESCSRDIEIITGIKPSTISIMLKKLREDRIITAAKKNNNSRGRGVTFYSLSGSIDNLIDILSEKKMSETSLYINEIVKVKEFVR